MSEFGVPREVRDLEMRVGLTPGGVLALVQAGHTVYLESNAGQGAGFSDEAFRKAGAQIVYSAAEAYGRAEIVVKVARPTAEEHKLFRPGQTIVSFLHLPVASRDLLQALEEKHITAIAYEMLEKPDGRRPVLITASEVAGWLAPTVAAQMLRSDQFFAAGRHGIGVLLSGLPGVPAATVVIVGAGVLGQSATRAFVGAGAEVIVLDRRHVHLRQIYEEFGGRVTTMFSSEYNLKRAVQFADVLVGAVSVPGERAPVLVTREMVRSMRPGAVIIDFSIDQGGCVETSRPTTLRDAAYVAEDVIHYCVPNLTAVTARTTSHAITNAAIPYLLAIGGLGLIGAIHEDPSLIKGVNVYQGKLAHAGVAAALGREAVVNLTANLPEGANQ
ncbi:MAG: alanine dehydrogenase [Chloroflexota bacterium]|nr:alanine dehydrogenase [Anaerolineales bacterium]MCA9978364.1 alanine dehydrogenase [Anaerolineales bacterium]MCB8967717.1 alanine dehydrogenase [Ardenticatenaceae bacterium]